MGLYIYNIHIPYNYRYRDINVSEYAMPCMLAPCKQRGWIRRRTRQVGSRPWKRCQGSRGKQLSETLAGRSPAIRSSRGEGKCRCTHLSLSIEFTRGNG